MPTISARRAGVVNGSRNITPETVVAAGQTAFDRVRGFTYRFENGRLERIDFDIGDRDLNLTKLVKPLGLKQEDGITWTGLDGAIYVGPPFIWVGERTEYSIGLNYRK